MTKKKQVQTQAELTDNKNNKDPHRRKQQKALSDGAHRIRNLAFGVKLGEKLATKLGIKIANIEARKIKKKMIDNLEKKLGLK